MSTPACRAKMAGTGKPGTCTRAGSRPARRTTSAESSLGRNQPSHGARYQSEWMLMESVTMLYRGRAGPPVRAMWSSRNVQTGKVQQTASGRSRASTRRSTRVSRAKNQRRRSTTWERSIQWYRRLQACGAPLMSVR